MPPKVTPHLSVEAAVLSAPVPPIVATKAQIYNIFQQTNIHSLVITLDSRICGTD